jgi:MFS family permease
MSTRAKLGLLGSLYFSQGLPFGFFTQVVPVLLREKGVSLGAIGLSSLLALPWALKFLWAPAVDRYSIPGMGRRRSWIVPLQLASVALLLVLALAGWTSMGVLMGASFLLNLIAATQDIATDGLAIDLLLPEERGFANGLQVAAYRVGMIASGGWLLLYYDEYLGSVGTYLLMAGMTAFATLPALAAREPRQLKADGKPRGPHLHFLHRPGVSRLLLLIVTYKAGDALASGMFRPFLVDAGLDKEDIGRLVGIVGFASGLAGAFCGGALIHRLGRKTSLVVFGLLQAASVAGYAYLALGKPSWTALNLLCAAEHFVGGMATVALFTCMMDWCSRRTSATDYTVQASAVVIATGIASTVAGFSAQALGYFAHFCLSAGLALAGLALVFRCFPTAEEARLIRAETREAA